MPRPLSAVLRLETIEQRLCPATGIVPGSQFLTVIQNEGGSAETAKLLQQVQAGQAAVAGLIASQAGPDDFSHILADYQLTAQIATNGALAGIEMQVSVTAQNYITNPTPATANSLNLALESAAFAFGALNQLATDYQQSLPGAYNALSSLDPGLPNAVNQNINSVQAAANYILNTIQQLPTDAAIYRFSMPVIPGTIVNVNGTYTNVVVTGSISGSGSGTFDPDNDGDDDTGMAGY